MKQVSRDVMENSVLQIFLDYRVPAGGRLMFSDLRETWPASGMRQSDLVEGLKHLVFDGLLELEDEAAGPTLVLSPAGYARAHKLPSHANSRSVLKHFHSLGESMFSLKRRRPGAGRRVNDASMIASSV